jgi:hypothetical protein
MIKGLIPLLLALGGCAAPALSQERECKHPAPVRGYFDARAPEITVSVRANANGDKLSRNLDKIAKRLGHKYHFDAIPVYSIHAFGIPNVTTEVAARELAERLRCEPDVEAIDFMHSTSVN